MTDRETTKLDGDLVSTPELDLVRSGVCPDCAYEGFMIGPSGGESQNLKCDQCGSAFNDLEMFGVERISDASPDRERSE